MKNPLVNRKKELSYDQEVKKKGRDEQRKERTKEGRRKEGMKRGSKVEIWIHSVDFSGHVTLNMPCSPLQGL